MTGLSHINFTHLLLVFMSKYNYDISAPFILAPALELHACYFGPCHVKWSAKELFWYFQRLFCLFLLLLLLSVAGTGNKKDLD